MQSNVIGAISVAAHAAAAAHAAPASHAAVTAAHVATVPHITAVPHVETVPAAVQEIAPAARPAGTIYTPATDPVFIAARSNAAANPTDAQEMIAQPVLDPEPDHNNDGLSFLFAGLAFVVLMVGFVMVLASRGNRRPLR